MWDGGLLTSQKTPTNNYDSQSFSKSRHWRLFLGCGRCVFFFFPCLDEHTWRCLRVLLHSGLISCVLHLVSVLSVCAAELTGNVLLTDEKGGMLPGLSHSGSAHRPFFSICCCFICSSTCRASAILNLNPVNHELYLTVCYLIDLPSGLHVRMWYCRKAVLTCWSFPFGTLVLKCCWQQWKVYVLMQRGHFVVPSVTGAEHCNRLLSSSSRETSFLQSL